jgi:hypothetical protein
VTAVLGTACGGQTIDPDNFIPPTVQLHHLSVKNAGVMGGTMDVVMAIYNPNRAEIKGTRLQGQLDIESSRVGDVVYTQPFELEDRDTTLVTVPMQFKWTGAGAALKGVLGYGTVKYTMNGTVTMDTPAGKPFDVPFSGQGSAAVLKP